MKSTVCRLVLALLSLWAGLEAAPPLKARPVEPSGDLNKIRQMTKHLLGDTKKLYNIFKAKYPAEVEHKLEFLPTVSMNAGDLAKIQVAKGLAKLSADLQIYQKHFDWLQKVAPILRPQDNAYGSFHHRIENLTKEMEHLMAKLNLPWPTVPVVPPMPTSATHWPVVHTGHALFHNFHLFLDWASRVLMHVKL
ncbi:interleukin-11 [Lissotriton helveticus]